MEIIAHRGASHDAPENTLAAVQLAWQQNADAVEIDVRFSRDGKIVVIHDANTKRTCGVTEETVGWTIKQSGGRAVHPLPRGGGESRGEGETAASRRVLVDPLTLTLSPSEGERETNTCNGRPSHSLLSNGQVSERTLAELKTLDAGQWKGRQWTGEKIPTLDEVMAAVPNGKKLLIEIKCGPELIPELKRALRRAGLQPEQILLASFSLPTLALVKRAIPKPGACWITEFRRRKPGDRWSPNPARVIQGAKNAGLDGLDLRADGPVDATLVRQAKSAGLKLFVWTVDSVEAARKLIAAGVDGITTNRPGWLRENLAHPEMPNDECPMTKE